MSERTPEPIDPSAESANPNPQDPQTPTPAAPAAGEAEAKPRKRRRRWPWVLGALLLLLIVVVLLAPTIASTGVVRGIVVSEINDRINGHVQIADLSLGWTSGMKIDGLVIYDESNRQILQLPHMSSGLTLLNLARGRYNLGRTVIDGLDVLVSRDAQGRLNWAKLMKSGNAPPSKSAEPQPSSPESRKPSKLPDVNGELVVSNSQVTWEDPSQGPPLFLRHLQADVKIPDINSTISDSLSTQAQIGSNPPGTLNVTGTLDAIHANQIDTKTPGVDQTIAANGVDLGAVSTMLGHDLGVTLAGRTDGKVQLKLSHGTDAVVLAAVNTAGFSAGGPKLKGDTFSADTVSFNLPQTTIHAPQGLDQWKTARLHVGTSAGDALQFRLNKSGKDLTLVRLAGDFSPADLLNEAKAQAQVSPGQVQLDANADLAGLAAMLRSSLNGLQIPSGTLAANVATQFGGGTFTPKFDVKLADFTLLNDQGGTARPVLQKYGFSLTGDGAFKSTAAGSTATLNVDLADNQGLMGLKSVEPINVSLPAQGNPSGAGKVNVAFNVKQISDVMKSLSAPGVQMTDAQGMELKDGVLTGTVSLAQATAEQISLDGKLSLIRLTLGNGTETPINGEQVNIAFNAVSNHDASDVRVPQLEVASNLLGVASRDLALKLSNGANAPPVSTLDRLQKGSVTITVPSLPNLQKLLRALSPPEKGTKVARSVPGPAFAAASKLPPAGAAPPATQPTTQPTDLTNGSATITLDVDHDGPKLRLTPKASLKDVAIRRGIYSYTVGNVDLDANAQLTPAPTSNATTQSSVAEQIASAHVDSLHLAAPNLGGLDVSLPEPLDVVDPAGLAQLFAPPAEGARPTAASMNGRVLVRLDPNGLMTLQSVLSGEAPSHTYNALCVIDEKFQTTPDGTINATGRSDVNNLLVDQQPYPEKQFQLISDVGLSGRSKTLDLRNIALLSATTKGLNVTVRGKVTDLGGRQAIDHVLSATLDYDAAVAWKMILPLLSKSSQEKMKDAKVEGKYQKRIDVSGNYPAGEPFNEAIKPLVSTGEIALDTFDGQGVILHQFNLPFVLQNGAVRVAVPGKPPGQDAPPPVYFNGGTMDLAGATVDLTGEHPRLTTPANLALIKGATLNPLFAAWALGDYLNNPAFVGVTKASGIVNVTVVQCDRLPLDSTLTSTNDGSAVLDLSIKGLQVGNPNIEKVTDALGVNLRSFQGDVQSYRVTIGKGITHQDLSLAFGENKRPLRIFGDVRMSDKTMLPVTFDVPWKLLGLSRIDQNVQKFLPEGIQIPLKGKLDNPQFAVDVNKIVGDATKNAVQQGLLKNIVPGAGNNGATSQPANQDPLNQIGNILQGLEKKKK